MSASLLGFHPVSDWVLVQSPPYTGGSVRSNSPPIQRELQPVWWSFSEGLGSGAITPLYRDERISDNHLVVRERLLADNHPIQAERISDDPSVVVDWF